MGKTSPSLEKLHRRRKNFINFWGHFWWSFSNPPVTPHETDYSLTSAACELYNVFCQATDNELDFLELRFNETEIGLVIIMLTTLQRARKAIFDSWFALIAVSPDSRLKFMMNKLCMSMGFEIMTWFMQKFTNMRKSQTLRILPVSWSRPARLIWTNECSIRILGGKWTWHWGEMTFRTRVRRDLVLIKTSHVGLFFHSEN